MKRRQVARLRGRWGLWQLEAWCGACSSGASCGPPVAERTEPLVTAAMEARATCEYCQWPLSFGWLFVPKKGPPGSAA
jgi:hypothetical protein